MMDIVERLRGPYEWECTGCGRIVLRNSSDDEDCRFSFGILKDAADTIERLQAELDLERRRLKTSESLRTGLVAEIERLRVTVRTIADKGTLLLAEAEAEIERLQVALAKIRDVGRAAERPRRVRPARD
jgi:hypothetical protein